MKNKVVSKKQYNGKCALRADITVSCKIQECAKHYTKGTFCKLLRAVAIPTNCIPLSETWPCAESTILYLSKSFYSGDLTPRNSRHGRICTRNRSVHAAENDLLFQQESTTNRTIPYYPRDIFYRIQHSKSFIASIWRWWDGFRKTRPKSLIGDDNKHYWFTNYTRQTFPEVYQSCQAK